MLYRRSLKIILKFHMMGWLRKLPIKHFLLIDLWTFSTFLSNLFSSNVKYTNHYFLLLIMFYVQNILLRIVVFINIIYKCDYIVFFLFFYLRMYIHLMWLYSRFYKYKIVVLILYFHNQWEFLLVDSNFYFLSLWYKWKMRLRSSFNNDSITSIWELKYSILPFRLG